VMWSALSLMRVFVWHCLFLVGAVSLNEIKRKHASFIQLVFICMLMRQAFGILRGFLFLNYMLGEVQTHTYVALPSNRRYKLFVKIIDWYSACINQGVCPGVHTHLKLTSRGTNNQS
jgi:hypothetical protein